MNRSLAELRAKLTCIELQAKPGLLEGQDIAIRKNQWDAASEEAFVEVVPERAPSRDSKPELLAN